MILDLSFQQIGLNICAGDTKILREMDANELAKTRRVVITRGLGISVRLQDRIGLNNLILQTGFDGLLESKLKLLKLFSSLVIEFCRYYCVILMAYIWIDFFPWSIRCCNESKY